MQGLVTTNVAVQHVLQKRNEPLSCHDQSVVCIPSTATPVASATRLTPLTMHWVLAKFGSECDDVELLQISSRTFTMRVGQGGVYHPIIFTLHG